MRNSYRMERYALYTMMIFCIIAIFLTLLLIKINLNDVTAEHEMIAKKAILQSLGVSSLSISDDCTSTKNVLSDLCGCLSDIPGGYCYHEDCNSAFPNLILR